MEGPEIPKENSEDLKYFCKICKRKFACGRALGGHMRAHGAAEEEDMQRRAKSREPKGTPVLLCEEEEEEEEEGWNSMYSLRRNPKRSWRFSDRDYSLLEQNPKEIWESSGENCRRDGDVFRQNTGENPERNWGIPPGSSESGSESGSGADSERNPAGFHSPAKGMRSKRFPTRNSDEEDMAYCLVMLASGARKAEEECPRPADSSATSACGDAKPEEEGASEIEKGCGSRSKGGELGHAAKKNSAYECKTCRRIFHTYQALGGHRASHRKVKGCFAKITLLHQHGERFCQNLAEFSCSEEIADATCAATRAPKVHECSICRRTFASGQALGGHKRCHFLISDAKQPRRIEPAAAEELLDLNQPAPAEDDHGLRGGDATRPVQPVDVEPRASCHVRPWWMESDAKQGLFL